MKTWMRVILGVLLVAAVIVGLTTDVFQELTPERMRTFIQLAGVYGVLLLLGGFMVSNILQIPGMLFVAASILAYGQLWGGILAMVGGVLAVLTSFVVIRAVGGKALDKIEKPFIKKILDRLDERPVRTIAVVRLFTWLSPPVNAALALSRVRFRDYAVGSTLGLLLPITVAAVLFDQLFGLG